MNIEWQEYHNENGGTQFVGTVPEGVTDVSTYSGERLQVKEGDLIAQTERPDQYTRVADLDGWSLKGVESYDAPDDTVPTKAPKFDPEDHNVSRVKAELDQARTNEDEESFNRIVEAERDGKNRAGIVSQTY